MGQIMKLLQSMVKEQPGAKEMIKKLIDDELSTSVGSPADVASVSPTSPAAPVLSAPAVESAPGTPAVEPTSIPATPAVEPTTTATPAVSPPSSGPDPAGAVNIVPARVNSNTCRNQHARLQRRMLTCDPAKFPHMSKLWHGNRADSVAKFFLHPKGILIFQWLVPPDIGNNCKKLLSIWNGFLMTKLRRTRQSCCASGSRVAKTPPRWK